MRNLFPGARALVTIERFGVIKSWVQTLEGNTPVVEFPIEPDYLPGFYLSVVVMSPRVAPAPGVDPVDGNGVDLGRPTYRDGLSADARHRPIQIPSMSRSAATARPTSPARA